MQDFTILEHDQHFCHDETILNAVIKTAHLLKKDIVLEIGPGKGDLTKKIASKVNKVIAVEIDERLKTYLHDLPSNVEVVFQNIMNFIPQRKDFNKVVANIPYQICEPLLKYLCTARQIQLSVLTVPKGFAVKAQQHPIFSAFLNIEIIQDVPKEAFTPPPKVLSAIIKINPNTQKDENAFIRRKLYLQRDKKLKNGLLETIIDVYQLKHKERLPKKKAQEMMDSLDLPVVSLMEKLISRLPLEEYTNLAEKVEKLFKNL